jgi:hypothetical protein
MKKHTRDRSSLADLRPTRRVASRHWFLGVTLLEIKGRALPLELWVCWLAFLVVQPHWVG